MILPNLLQKLSSDPAGVTFDETIAVIEVGYEFHETAFWNGGVSNGAGENNGSCKIFAFGGLNNLTEQLTLHCFGEYYRTDVLGNPDGSDHQNIRCFMQTSWAGIQFDGPALTRK